MKDECIKCKFLNDYGCHTLNSNGCEWKLTGVRWCDEWEYTWHQPPNWNSETLISGATCPHVPKRVDTAVYTCHHPHTPGHSFYKLKLPAWAPIQEFCFFGIEKQITNLILCFTRINFERCLVDCGKIVLFLIKVRSASFLEESAPLFILMFDILIILMKHFYWYASHFKHAKLSLICIG